VTLSVGEHTVICTMSGTRHLSETIDFLWNVVLAGIKTESCKEIFTSDVASHKAHIST
jgi:hypothetical protein